MAEGSPLQLARAQRGERAFGDYLGSNQVAEAADLGADGLIARPVLVSQHGQLDLLATPEVRGVTRAQLADQDEVGARRVELFPGAVQLDRVSLAINSAVVAQPDQRRRLLAPEVPQPDLVSVLVGQDDVGQGVGGCRHRVKPTLPP